MPLYEYQCDACGHRFEVIQKFSDEPIAVCPKCEGSVRKLLSSPAIQFKGSGWYITDYARKPSGGQGAGKSDSEKGDGDTKKESTSKDTSKDSTSSSRSTTSTSSSSKSEAPK